MTQSKFTYLYSPGAHRSIELQIGARADPNPNNIESFAVVLFFELEDGTVVEVAKVDNSEHRAGTIHVDRYYREVGTDIKDYDVEISSMWDADEYLQNNWQRFAQVYFDNHGKNQREE